MVFIAGLSGSESKIKYRFTINCVLRYVPVSTQVAFMREYTPAHVLVLSAQY